MKNAKELLEEIKNNNVRYAIVNENGAVFSNKDTDNIMDIFSFDDDVYGRFYGVYGDSVGGQVDSRQASDEVILDAIETMLLGGKAVKRSELNFKDLKRAYWTRTLEEEAIKQRIRKSECPGWLKNEEELVSGAVVEHKKYGKGKIINVSNINSKENAVISINFFDFGKKSFSLEFLIEEGLLTVL